MALSAAAMVPATDWKVAVVAPAATVTEPCTGNTGLLLDSATTAPPAGAGPVSVTVQVVVSFDFRLAGAHAKAVTLKGVLSGMTAVA
jgi:hypothetical protein